MKHFTLFTLILVTLAAIVLVACGDDDDGGGNGTPTVSPGGSINANAVQQLRDLAGKWSGVSGKVTYTLTNAAGDANVVVTRQSGNSRIDHTLADRTTTVIVLSDVGYSCSTLGNTCASLPVDQAKESAGFIPFVGSLADSDSLEAIIAGSSGVEGASGRNIAGRDTACIKISGDLGGIPGPGTFCFSDDGLLLYIGLEGTAAFEMTARNIEEAQESDFEPPYTVVSPQATAAP
jgi:hypothetical protein